MTTSLWIEREYLALCGNITDMVGSCKHIYVFPEAREGLDTGIDWRLQQPILLIVHYVLLDN